MENACHLCRRWASGERCRDQLWSMARSWTEDQGTRDVPAGWLQQPHWRPLFQEGTIRGRISLPEMVRVRILRRWRRCCWIHSSCSSHEESHYACWLPGLCCNHRRLEVLQDSSQARLQTWRCRQSRLLERLSPWDGLEQSLGTWGHWSTSCYGSRLHRWWQMLLRWTTLNKFPNSRKWPLRSKSWSSRGIRFCRIWFLMSRKPSSRRWIGKNSNSIVWITTSALSWLRLRIPKNRNGIATCSKSFLFSTMSSRSFFSSGKNTNINPFNTSKDEASQRTLGFQGRYARYARREDLHHRFPANPWLGESHSPFRDQRQADER